MPALQSTPYTFPLLLSALTAAGLGYLIWLRRPAPGVYTFVILMFGVFEWSLCNALQLMTTDFQTKLFFTSLAYIGITIVPLGWLTFALEYTGREKWLTRRTLILLMIQPILAQIAIWTNSYHHLWWSSVTVVQTDGFLTLDAVANTLFWVHAVYSYLIILIATVLLVQAMVRSPALYRGQTVTLLLGAFAPWIANILYITKLSPFGLLDITPFSFMFLGLMLAWSMVRFHLLDIAPIARDRVFENMRDAVLVLDTRNRVVDINRTALEIVAASTSDVIGQPALKVLAAFPELLTLFGTTDETSSEIVLTTAGQERYFQLAISPLKNRQGQVTGRLFVAHEISDLKQASEQIKTQNNLLMQTNQDLAVAQKKAEEASRLKSEFLATMSHELRTPLGAIIGYSELMLSGSYGPITEKQADRLQRVMENGKRLLALINDVLDLSKIEARRLTLVDVAFSPADLLNGINTQLRSLADQKGLRFDATLDPALPPQLKGDPGRLQQILVNLIGNAIRFTSSGGVTVQIAKSGDSEWSLSVTDTGIGIPPEALDYIFDEFRQVDGSPSREYGGTGLGLAIVRQLATLMKGSVRVESVVGQGSTFIVQLPLRLAETPLVNTVS